MATTNRDLINRAQATSTAMPMPKGHPFDPPGAGESHVVDEPAEANDKMNLNGITTARTIGHRVVEED